MSNQFHDPSNADAAAIPLQNIEPEQPPQRTGRPSGQGETSPQGIEMSPEKLRAAVDRLRAEQNLPLGIMAGLIGALVGAVLWAGVTVATGYQIGWMAVGIGFLVGLLMRATGKGMDPVFGVAGAGLALFGCLLGNLLAVVGMVSIQEGVSFFQILPALDLAAVKELMVLTFHPLDLLFYGIAVYEGYKLSFRQIAQEELTAS